MILQCRIIWENHVPEIGLEITPLVACLPKVDKRGKYTMRARVAMPCTCAWQCHARVRGNTMGARVVYPCTSAWSSHAHELD